jgi:hypothetical protein
MALPSPPRGASSRTATGRVVDDLSDIASVVAREPSSPAQMPRGRIAPDEGVLASLSPEKRRDMEILAGEVTLLCEDGVRRALAHIRAHELSQEELIGMWSLLDSAHRTALRKAGL